MDDLKELRVELLVSLQKDDISCPDITSFNGLLTSTGLVTTDDSLSYSDLTVKYGVILTTTDQDERIFHVTLKCTDIDKIKAYEDILRRLKQLFSKSRTHMRLLWTDISLYYCTKAYPLIYHVENLMRNLIDQFMYLTIGHDWERALLSQELQRRNQNTEEKHKSDPFTGGLQAIDFVQLSNFLFRPYSSRSPQKLMDKLRDATKLEDLDLDDLKAYIPVAPWDRHFAEIVDYDGKKLESEWKELYNLRCAVAHNRPIGSSDYARIEELATQISATLQQAIDNLSSVKVTKLQAETLEKEMREKYTRSRRSSDLSKIPSRFNTDNPLYESMLQTLFDVTTASQAQDMLLGIGLAAEYERALGIPSLDALRQHAELQEQMTASLQGMGAVNLLEHIETAADLFTQLEQQPGVSAEALLALDVDQELLASAAHIDDGLLAIDASAELKRFNALINPEHDTHNMLGSPKAATEDETDEDE